MASKVFISWSGDLSRKLAETLREWLPGVLQFVKPYFTPDDIEKGSRWGNEISTELSNSNIGIICLTKDNTNNPWILFEAGALSKKFDKALVCPILFNLEPSDVTGPLTEFQATKFSKSDVKKLITTINNTDSQSQLEPDVLNSVFDMWWPKLEEKVKAIIKEEKNVVTPKKRSDRDLLEEILDLSRLNVKRNPSRVQRNSNAIAYIIDKINEIRELTFMEYGDDRIMAIFESIDPAIQDLCLEINRPDLYEMYKDREMMRRDREMMMIRRDREKMMRRQDREIAMRREHEMLKDEEKQSSSD